MFHLVMKKIVRGLKAQATFFQHYDTSRKMEFFSLLIGFIKIYWKTKDSLAITLPFCNIENDIGILETEMEP